jgi:hypothetical protein
MIRCVATALLLTFSVCSQASDSKPAKPSQDNPRARLDARHAKVGALLNRRYFNH